MVELSPSEKKVAEMKPETEKGRNMNMSIPKQLLSQSYIPPINTSIIK